MIPRRFLAVFAGLALVIARPAFAESPHLAALISDTSNPYWKAFEDGLRDTSRALAAPVDIYTLQNATDAEGQLNECETALLKKPAGILFAAVNGINLASCLRKAEQAGIVLIDVDGNVDEALGKKMGIAVAFSVASNNYDLGALAGDYLKDKQGKTEIIEGLSGSQPSELRVQGFKDHAGKGLAIVGSQSASWDRLKANELASRALIQHPDLSVIFAANDTMALGAVEALRAAGKENVTVVGIDGSTDAVKAVKDGRLAASVAQLPYLMAKEAVEKAIKYLADRKPLPFHQYVPIVVLDRAVLSRGDNPLLQYVR